MTVTGGYGLAVDTGGYAQVQSGVVFGTAIIAHIQCAVGQVAILAAYTMSGSAASHWATVGSGLIANNAGPITITLTGTPNFTTAFAYATGGAIYTWNGLGSYSFSGSATGARYLCVFGGAVNTAGQATTYLPGNAAGSTGSGTNTGFYG